MMPSLSPPPLKQRTSAPKLTTSSSSVITSAAPITTKATANSNLESEADARLRDPQWPTRSSSSSSTAFGGKRRSGRTDMGLKQREWVILAGIMVVGCGVRFYKIGWPTSVVFDEVHFGGFAAKYIRQKFFMDVHPPLAKLLITLAAFIGGFDGEFDFKDIGKDYLEPDVPYVIMRLFPALLGLGLVPLSFLTLLALRLSLPTAILGALLVTFDNALITQSRLILLDSFLMFFTGLTIYFWVRFSNLDLEGRAFTRIWWTYLTLSGTALGAVVSCKWVGLFTIATVGMGTLRQLWLLLGNTKVSPRMWIKHFAARTLCLIVVPIAFYMFMFQIHFWILSNSGEGDGFMSSEFQHTLSGHGMEDTYADVSYGSLVSIRHVHTQGGYLHSHAHAYPAGSQRKAEQQITLYPHRDENNVWRIVNPHDAEGPALDYDELPMQPVLTGSKLRLEHKVTDKRLHSHDVRPPISDVDFQNEVSGYGFEGFAGDANDDFVIEIARKTRGRTWDRQARHRLRTLRSEFRLRHILSGCYLFSHKVKLPEWGFEQQEVTCNKNPTWENSLWYIETNEHAQLSFDAEKVNYVKPGFFDKFFELQAVMWHTNAGLTDRHSYDSRPQHWPILRRGINFWVKEHRQVYLVGNPVVWWASTLGIILYLLMRGILILRAKRGFRDLSQPKTAFYDEVCGFLVLSWALHFLPFFLMQRQLFLHHYLPALYFAVLCFCAVFDYVTSRLRPRTRVQIAAIVLILVVWSYTHFSPLTYATPWTKGKCERAKWLTTWDFSCNDFLDNLSSYKVGQYEAVNSQMIGYDGLSAGGLATTIVDEAPEPIKNAFDDPNAPPEEKTVAPVGPKNEVPMQQSTVIAPVNTVPADKPEDLRAPVGLDAGAPEVTDAAEDDGGWHGGAEEDQRRDIEEEAQVKGAPLGAKVEVQEMGLDEEAKKLVEAAMRDDEGM